MIERPRRFNQDSAAVATAPLASQSRFICGGARRHDPIPTFPIDGLPWLDRPSCGRLPPDATMSNTTADHPLRGVLLSGAVLVMACMDTTTKLLATRYQIPVVMAARYVVHALLMLMLLAPSQGRLLVQTRRTRLVLVRAACLAGASLLVGLALTRMPVAEATAVVFMAPLLVVLLAGQLLREQVGLFGWLAAIAGFGGVLMIARPGGGLDPGGVVFALGAAALIAAYQLLSRVLASSERTLALLFYTALVGALLFGLLLPWYWDGQPPTLLQAVLLLGMGVMGGLGHYLFTSAHRYAPASTLAPVMYVQLVWASLLGWLVFDHVPEPLSLLGMGVVAVSGVAVALHSRASRRTLAIEAASG